MSRSSEIQSDIDLVVLGVGDTQDEAIADARAHGGRGELRMMLETDLITGVKIYMAFGVRDEE